jgi:hypothetical protein
MGFPKPMRVAKSRSIKFLFMKMKELELSGSTELSKQEMNEIHGGGIAPGWLAILWSAVSNFGDIREGFSDGFNNKPPRY